MTGADRQWLWLPALLIALLFLYMGLGKILQFSPEFTNEIFRRLGIWLGMGYVIKGGPYLVGIIELVAAVLLVTRRGQPWGALIAFVVLSGAVFLHLLGPIGLVVEISDVVRNPETGKFERISESDGASTFIMALIGWVLAATLLWFRRDELPVAEDLIRAH